MELPPQPRLERQRSSEEIQLEDIRQDVESMYGMIEEAEKKQEEIENRAEIAQGGDRRGKRALRAIFIEKVLGDELATITFQGWASRNNVPLQKTQAGKISKRAITDKVMKSYIENLNADQVKLSGLKEEDVALLKGKAQQIRAQQRVMPSALNLVAQKGPSVDIMPDPSFGVNKSVAQKSQGTDLNLGEYARATGLNEYEAMALVGQGGRSMVAPKVQREEEKKLDERVRAEVRAGGGPALDIIRETAGSIEEGMFGDNMIREVNAGLTGLEENPLIYTRDRVGIREVRFKNILEEPTEEKYAMQSGPILRQDEMLNGPDNEMQHADPNDDRELMNVGARKLAENNQYTGDQKDFMQRIDANKNTRGIIESKGLDSMLGVNPPRNEGDKREGEEEKYEQEEIGGGMGDEEGDDLGDVRVREGGQSMREIIENEISKRMLQPRGQWAGNRGGSSDWTRPFEADKEGNALRNSQSLAYLRNTGIPYKMPSRTYANNSVGLIRNSNRSMILQVNELEP
jgi:hypothetical protein